MGHKFHHHSKEKERRGRSKHRHHKSHSKRSLSSSSNSSLSSSSSSYSSSSDSYSHKKKKHHHNKHHHKDKKKQKISKVSVTSNENSLTENENKERKNILIGPSLPSNFEKPNNIKENLYENNKENKKFVGPVLPSFLEKNNEDVDKSDKNDSLSLSIGPYLPSSHNNSNTEQNSKIIGPSLPSQNNENNIQESKVYSTNKLIKSEEDDDEIIGPLPLAPGHELTEEEETQRIVKEFEERADRMKRKLEGKEELEKPKKLVRDEWMTSLPEDNILDRINILKPRQFRKNGVTKIDRSGWTDTPADKLKKQKEGIKNEEEKVEYIQINKNDIEMQKMIDQYNKEHRSESLYDQHAKEYFKNKKYEENDISKLPFNRERDVLGTGSKGSIGKTNQLKNVLGIESANRFTHSSNKRFL